MPKRLSIEMLRDIAASRGGELLSSNYLEGTYKLLWKCSKGHVWWARNDLVRKGSWCKKCLMEQLASINRLDIAELKQIAESRDGKLLSEMYENSNAKLLWRCDRGHTWFANASSIRSGHWCRECAKDMMGAYRRHTIEYVRNVAKAFGGSLLSESYKNNSQSLRWMCKDGHVFNKSLASVWGRRLWCTTCSNATSYGESICRMYFQHFLNEDFPARKPSWLGGLFLDGFSENLKLAFEYQGQQHYGYVEFFHRNEQGYIEQLQRDKLKRILCEENNVKLIYVPFSVPFEEIGRYVVDSCRMLGFNVGDAIPKLEEISVLDRGKLEEFEKIANEKGGHLLSTSFLGTNVKALWQCSKGHEWMARPNDIKRGRWCRFCCKPGRKPGSCKNIEE